jgi:DNA-binding Xre family transcriptional regulator
MMKVRLIIKDIAEGKGIPNPFILSSKSGLNYAICYKLWHEKQQRIDLKTIAVLCEALEVEPGSLFDYKKDEENQP